MADPRLLFLSLTNDIGSDRIVSELGRYGAACAVLAPARAYATLPRCVGRHYAIPARLGVVARALALRSRLTDAVRSWHPTGIIPLDELSALLLRSIARETRTLDDVRALLVRSLGRVDGYAAACHRVPLMETAAQVGVAIPPFFSVPGRDRCRHATGFPMMVKRDHSSGSGGVVVAGDEVHLAKALRAARLKQEVKRGLSRLAGFDHGDAAILVQQFVPGRLAMHTAVACEGRTIDGQSLLAVRSHPQKRSSTVLQPIESSAMAEAARRIIEALGCSGFVSFDFIVDESEQPLLIEMNPRPIGSTHLGRLFGHDLAAAFLTGQASGGTPQDEIVDVALFPKELERAPDAERMADLYHDVPWDEPHVLAAYVEHLARLHPGHAEQLRRLFGRSDRRKLESVRRAPAELSQA